VNRRWQIFSSRIILFAVILGIHTVVILGPVGCFWLKNDENKKKEIAFKVQLGGLEPSHAPEVGPPERTRPTGAPPAPEPPAPLPAPPEPPEPKPLPAPPAPPKPKPQVKKPVPKPPKPKPQVKKPVPKPPKPVKPKIDPNAAARRRQQQRIREIQARNRRREAEKQRLQAGVYRPAGGNNFNPNVKIGTRNTGQKFGKQDNRTPAGGASAATEEEWKKFDKSVFEIISDKWHPPAGIWVDDSTSAVIAIRLDSKGRVIGKKMEKPSPNAAVNASAKRLLDNLNQMPVPPGKTATNWLTIVLKQTL